MAQPLELRFLLKQIIPASPFASKTYLVGGCVRDRLLNQVVKDLDCVVEQPGGARQLAEYLHELNPKIISKPHELGAGYPIWQIVFKESFPFKGRVYDVGGCGLEIADTQKELFPDPQSRARITEYGTLMEDCKRRDFTCNMLYEDLTQGEIVDPSDCGVEDIKKGVLRGHPRVSLVKIFSDDPLRMLRLIRFRCRFGWKIDPKAMQALDVCRDRLKILSHERVRDELIKIIEDGKLYQALELLRETRILNVLFPEFLPMIGCEQDATYHSEGDVWVHTCLVVKNAPKTLTLQLAALLHDIGKPASRSLVGQRVKFIEHEKISTNMTTTFMTKWKFPQELTHQVARLVELHLRGGDVENWKGLKAARKLHRDAKDQLEDLLTLIEADSVSSYGLDGKPRGAHLPILRKTLADAVTIPIRKTPLLNGHDIMRFLGLSPGPRVKEIQDYLLELEDQYAEHAKALSREDAIEAIRQRFGNPLPS